MGWWQGLRLVIPHIIHIIHINHMAPYHPPLTSRSTTNSSIHHSLLDRHSSRRLDVEVVVADDAQKVELEGMLGRRAEANELGEKQPHL